jgi:hemerythrin-like domain-containing protein
MTHAAVRIIRQEHAALGKAVRAMQSLLARDRHKEATPDIQALRALLFYVDEFSEKRHHRKESELLIPKLRAHSALARELLDRIEDDHARTDFKIRNVERALTAYEMMGEIRRHALEEAVDRFAQFCQEHMSLEEREVLPQAERVLSADEWIELDTAFCANDDYLAGQEPEDEYRAFFARLSQILRDAEAADRTDHDAVDNALLLGMAGRASTEMSKARLP